MTSSDDNRPGEVERLREAIEAALQCTPHIEQRYVGLVGMTYRPVITYDCGDPWEILRAALAQQEKTDAE